MLLKNSLLISIAFLISFNIYGQDKMERLYRSDRQNTGIDVKQTSDDGYLVLSAGRPLDSLTFEFYTVTKLTNKGDLAWSHDYRFEKKVTPDGALKLLEGDSFLITGVLQDTALNKILMKCDASGNVTLTRGYGRSDANLPSGFGDIAIDATLEGGWLIAGDVYEDNTNHDVFVTKVDASANLLWANALERTGMSDVIHKAKTTRDSGAILCGTTSHPANGNNILLIRTDSAGLVLWSRQYGTTINEMGTTVIQMPDDGFLIGGRKIESPGSFPGLLIKTDTVGVVQWVQKVDFGTTDTVHINDLLFTANGNVVVSGSLLSDTSSYAFMVNINLQGDILWKRKYKTATSQSITANGLIQANDGGLVYLLSSDEGGDQVGPYLIKSNVAGETLCDTVISESILFSDTIAIDTIVFTSTSLTSSKDITVVDTLNYGGFNPPTLVLETFGPYCPDEVFSDTYDATTPGAIAYEWSTDETTPMITVTEFGDYMVTVTMGEDYCYILCASSSIVEKPLPLVEVGIDQTPYCTEGFVNLSANASDATSIEWSTTETTSTIQVTNNGAYSVTATNECGEANASTNLVINTTPPSVTITSDGTFCTEGQETLFGNISGPVNSVLWSTGASTTSIIATQEDDYTITIFTEFCGENSADYEVIATPPTVNISSVGSLCEINVETQLLVANTTGPVNGYNWSTGATTDTIEILSQGSFAVTVTTEFCGESSASIEILCPLIVQVPNVFTPDGDEANDTFQPFFDIPASDFVEYRFTVYSRWGEKVFETTDPTEAWDGTYNNELAVSDVYIWTLEGKSRLGQEIDKSPNGNTVKSGDVTLLR